MNKLKQQLGKHYPQIMWLLIHAGIGGVFLLLKPLAKLYSPLLLIAGFIYVYRTKNKNNEVLAVCAYLASADVFMRMTNGLFFTEQMKYGIIVLMVMGMALQKISIKSIYYIVYILLLMPGIFLSAFNTLSYEAEFRKMIAFNLSGPVCTGICAIYCIDKKVTYKQFKSIMFWLLLPIISMAVYMSFFRTDLTNAFRNTASNFDASGGYGPNQVSVVIGVGMFVLLTRFFLYSKSLRLKLINGFLLFYLTYRGLITFSRGGIITAVVASILFLLVLIFFTKSEAIKNTVLRTVLFLGIGILGVWGYSNVVSNGLLIKRYNNQDALGREKEDALGGREELITYELDAFRENPFFGIGVGNNKFYRIDESGIEAASHNEITRLMAEHGLLGILAFAILVIVPLFRFWQVHKNVFALSFFAFWLLTINHNSTRIAMPAFLYGLSLLILYNEKPTVHRKQVIR